MMVEDITGSDTPAYQDPSQEKKGLGAFASSKRGKMVLGGVGVFALLAIAGALVFTFALQPAEPTTEEAMVPPAGSMPANQGAVVPVSSEATATPPETKPLSSTFAFRDVFVPTTNPATMPESSSGTSDTSGTTADTDGTSGDGDGDGSSDSDVPDDTLLLKSITTVDGEPVATFVWNGQTYEAGEGDTLGDTPWKVVSISGDTVVMMYGDSQVSLTVGQGVSK